MTHPHKKTPHRQQVSYTHLMPTALLGYLINNKLIGKIHLFESINDDINLLLLLFTIRKVHNVAEDALSAEGCDRREV